MFKCSDGACPKTELDGCCFYCPEKDHCDDACSTLAADCRMAVEISEKESLNLFVDNTKQVTAVIAMLTAQKKTLEEQEKVMKERLKFAMEAYGIKFADTPLLKLTYVAPSVATTIDTPKLKKLHPDIVAECSKESPRSAYVKIELKGGDKE